MVEGGQEWVGFKHPQGEFLPPGTGDQSLAGKVEEKRIIVVEFIQHCALVLSYESLSGNEREMWL